MNRVKVAFLAAMMLSLTTPASLAQGVIGGIVERFCGNCGAGRALDRGHAQMGNPLDVPGRVIRETGVETLGPLLAEAIRHSRDNARGAGTFPIPYQMRQRLSVYFAPQILDNVQYRVGQGHELSVQANSIRFGDALAVTLIDTVVFANHMDADNNDQLWAHELGHIIQYQDWGLSNFAKRYVRNYQDVEAQADRTRDAYIAAAQRQMQSQPQFPVFPSGPPPVAQVPVANMCVAGFYRCQMPSALPIGWSCNCGGWQGFVQY